MSESDPSRDSRCYAVCQHMARQAEIHAYIAGRETVMYAILCMQSFSPHKFELPSQTSHRSLCFLNDEVGSGVRRSFLRAQSHIMDENKNLRCITKIERRITGMSSDEMQIKSFVCSLGSGKCIFLLRSFFLFIDRDRRRNVPSFPSHYDISMFLMIPTITTMSIFSRRYPPQPYRVRYRIHCLRARAGGWQ